MGTEVREDILEKILHACNDHVKKHGMRKMSLSELKKLAGA